MEEIRTKMPLHTLAAVACAPTAASGSCSMPKLCSQSLLAGSRATLAEALLLVSGPDVV